VLDLRDFMVSLQAMALQILLSGEKKRDLVVIFSLIFLKG
jgi:hypothetical protein